MRNRNRRPALRRLVQRELHDLLRVRVERRRRFVQEQHFRITEERAGDGDALFLAA